MNKVGFTGLGWENNPFPLSFISQASCVCIHCVIHFSWLARDSVIPLRDNIKRDNRERHQYCLPQNRHFIEVSCYQNEEGSVAYSNILLLLLLFLFLDRVSLCSLGCPGTQSVVQASLEFRDLPASVLWVMGLKACWVPEPLPPG